MQIEHLNTRFEPTKIGSKEKFREFRQNYFLVENWIKNELGKSNYQVFPLEGGEASIVYCIQKHDKLTVIKIMGSADAAKREVSLLRDWKSVGVHTPEIYNHYIKFCRYTHSTLSIIEMEYIHKQKFNILTNCDRLAQVHSQMHLSTQDEFILNGFSPQKSFIKHLANWVYRDITSAKKDLYFRGTLLAEYKFNEALETSMNTLNKSFEERCLNPTSIHLDFRPGNVLLDSSGRLYVIDPMANIPSYSHPIFCLASTLEYILHNYGLIMFKRYLSSYQKYSKVDYSRNEIYAAMYFNNLSVWLPRFCRTKNKQLKYKLYQRIKSNHENLKLI